MNRLSCKVDSSRFSVLEFLALVGLIAGVFGAHSLFGLIGAFAVGVVLGTLMVCHGRDTKRTWLVVAGLAALFFAFTLPFAFIGSYGPILDRSNFPFQLAQMIEVSGEDSDDVKVFDLGSYVDSEYTWRLKVSDAELARVLEEYKMTSVPAAEIPAEFFEIFPRSWRPPDNSACHGYSTVDFPVLSRGPETDHFFGVYDPETDYLYVWCKSNF